MRFPNIMLRIARISKRRCHSVDEKEKGISKIRVAEAETATFEVTERKDWSGRVRVEKRIPHFFISFKTVHETFTSHGS